MKPLSLSELLKSSSHTADDLQSLQDIPASVSMLSSMACIRVSGDDASAFLQGQLSNQINDLDVGQQQLQSYCNPKGRALAVFRLLRDQHGFLLILPDALQSVITKRLQLYKMRAKVVVESVSDKALLGLVNVDSLNNTGAVSVWQIDQHRSIVLCEQAEVEPLLVALNLPLVADQVWQVADILSANGQVYAETYEEFIPQQINLDLTAGVSFTKGCYPGQEIIARLRYLGKLKQRMIIATMDNVEDASAIAPGTPLFTAQRQTKTGMVVDSVIVDNRVLLTAMIPSSYIDEGELMMGSLEGALLERLPMPYPVITEFDSTAVKV